MNNHASVAPVEGGLHGIMNGTVPHQSAWLNKSSATNLAAAACIVIALLLPDPVRRPILRIGLFALSGAITNWLAIYMLFEKVPGLYGSGVIPDRFEDFKREIHRLIMEEFFGKGHFERLFAPPAEGLDEGINFAPIIEQTDLSPAFDALVTVVQNSSFGGMLNMVGGTEALEPLRQPFIDKMQTALIALTQSTPFQDTVRAQLHSSVTQDTLRTQVDAMVRQRLEELTPQMVKEIMQKMIDEHLGWLVVWGGLFGGLIGLVTAFIPFF